jgi:hypothetical protein
VENIPPRHSNRAMKALQAASSTRRNPSAFELIAKSTEASIQTVGSRTRVGRGRKALVEHLEARKY